jgi:RES domain-containing protein
MAIVYCSSTLALAELEILVHVDHSEAPDNLVSFRCTIPDGVHVEQLDVGDLPANWQRMPGPNDLKELAFDWFVNNRAVALRVPSVVVPTELNVLLNPAHPDFKKVRIDPPVPLLLDPRLRPRGRRSTRRRKR